MKLLKIKTFKNKQEIIIKMEEKNAIIYVCNLPQPYLTIDFQKKTCETVCHMKNLNVLEIIEEEKDSKNIFDLLFGDEINYTHVVIYSVACLGITMKEMFQSIQKIIDSNISLISVSDPIDISVFGSSDTQNMILTVAIGSAIFQNNLWRDINEFEKTSKINQK